MDPLQNVSRKKMMIIVSSIILIQLAVITFFMVFEKNGYFADDVYSYGFANSNGVLNPIVESMVSKELGKTMRNTWTDSQTLRDYLTVSEEEIFSYSGILEVLKLDAHPPLFYFLLHFLCSLTPNVFSRWSGYPINVLGFILMQVFLYRLTLLISKNRFFSVLTITFFGLTSATVNMMCFIRMYILVTAFTVVFVFYSLRYLTDPPDAKVLNKNLFIAAISLYLASMTMYLSIMYAFMLTLFVCAAFLIRKNFRKMLCFGSFMALSILLMVLSFPISIEQLRPDQPALKTAGDYPYALQMRMCLHVISNGLWGVYTPVLPSMIPFYIFWSLVGILIIYLITAFLFRNESWFKSFQANLKSFFIKCGKKICSSFKKYGLTLLPVFLICVVILMIFGKRLMLYYYQYYGMRYYYILTPFIAMTVMLVLFKIIRNKYAVSVLTVLFIGISLIFGDKCFLENRFKTEELMKITEDSNVIVVEKGAVAFIYHIPDLVKSREFLYTDPESIKNSMADDEYRLKSKDSRPLYLMVDNDAYSLSDNEVRSVDPGSGVMTSYYTPDNDVINYFKAFPEYSKAEYLGDYETCYLYRLK